MSEVDIDDPRRCQGIRDGRQCLQRALEGRTKCAVCQRSPEGAVRNFMLTKWRDRIQRLSCNDSVQSLRDEVGTLKMLLETALNRCQNDDDLYINSTQIANLAEKCERAVTSCAKLEKSSGMMLDKGAALQIAGNIVSIIGEFVKDPVIIDQIGEAIVERVLKVEFKED
ncbi:MAG: hypothetical protein KGI50_06560 [Patescibacteria group bacterium]|nr:hypothetical protein [Patescibacteria group bacterium]